LGAHVGAVLLGEVDELSQAAAAAMVHGGPPHGHLAQS